jgi:16S rRNA (adenine1518-N6/adenine1519-N6)-dimethyltransferase
MEEIREQLRARGFLTKKSMGQNFLFDTRILGAIADDAEVADTDTVLEVGPGPGTLTRILSERAKKVVAVELDQELMPVLAETLRERENVTVVNADFTKLDLAAFYAEHLGEPFKVVANLPYNVANLIVMQLLESGLPVVSLTVLVQREVAQRMAAKENTPEYGALSCFIQYYSRPMLLTKVSPGAFYPPPKVVSQVVRLQVHEQKEICPIDEQLFFRVVNACFAMRRKTLANNLMASFALKREDAPRLIEECGLSATVRGEALSLNEMCRLSDALHKWRNGEKTPS